MHQTDSEHVVRGVMRDGQIQLLESTDWPPGTSVIVQPVEPPPNPTPLIGHVIIAGFGLAGRCVADLLSAANIPFRIVEKNPATVETQEQLGRTIIEGDITQQQTLLRADLPNAAALALTIPDEDAVFAAIKLAREIRPEIYIIARTNYTSKGLHAIQLGADDVVKAEQAVAIQFRERLSRHIRHHSRTESLDLPPPNLTPNAE